MEKNEAKKYLKQHNKLPNMGITSTERALIEKIQKEGKIYGEPPMGKGKRTLLILLIMITSVIIGLGVMFLLALINMPKTGIILGMVYTSMTAQLMYQKTIQKRESK